MRIYCHCNVCTQKVPLASRIKTRSQLANSWGINFFINCSHCGSQNSIHVNNVRAESSHKYTLLVTSGAGGSAGVIAGPLGVFIGLGAGAISGAIIVINEKKEIQNFNNYYL